MSRHRYATSLKNDVIAIFIFLLSTSIETECKTPKVSVTSKGLHNCGTQQPMPMELTDTSWEVPEPSVFVMSGCLTVNTVVNSTLVGFASFSMCDKTGKYCTPVMSFSRPDMCDAIKEKGTILSDMVGHVEGGFTGCPVSPGKYCLSPYTYSIPNGTKCGDLGGQWQLLVKLMVPSKETYLCQKWKVLVEADCERE